jgi:hypothetical protein
LNYIQLLDFKLTDERGIFLPFKVLELSVKAALKDGIAGEGGREGGGKEKGGRRGREQGEGGREGGGKEKGGRRGREQGGRGGEDEDEGRKAEGRRAGQEAGTDIVLVLPFPPEDKVPLLTMILKIFRIIGTRDEKGHAYEPLFLSHTFSLQELRNITEFGNFFRTVLASVGLKIIPPGGGEGKAVAAGGVEGGSIEFAIRYPLYVYTQLAGNFTLLSLDREYFSSGLWWDNEWEITK